MLCLHFKALFRWNAYISLLANIKQSNIIKQSRLDLLRNRPVAQIKFGEGLEDTQYNFTMDTFIMFIYKGKGAGL